MIAFRGPVLRSSVLALACLLLVATPGHAQVPSCLTGDWRANNVESTFRDAFAGSADVQIDSISGDITLSIRGDGAYELSYVGLTLAITTPSGPVSSVTDGPIHGTLRETQPGTIVGNVSDSTITSTVTIAGTTTTNTMSLPDDGSDSPVSYDCGLGQVTFSSAAPSSDRPFALTFSRR